jgi:hypothetical protein
MHNFRPGAAERVGAGEDAVRAIRPDIIYVSISGFGEQGPYAKQRTYDPMIQALSGLADIQRDRDTGRPRMVRTIIADYTTALTAAQAVTAALFARGRRSVPTCSFIPKCQLPPLRVCFISGSRAALAFLVELGAAMMVASTMVRGRGYSRRSSKRSRTASRIAWVSRCRSSRWRSAEWYSRPAPGPRPTPPARSAASIRCRRSRPRLAGPTG